MRKKKIFQKLIQKQKEIATPAPNELGVFTPLYRQIVIYFKVAPYRWLVPLAFIFAFAIYFLFRNRIIDLVTILQKSF